METIEQDIQKYRNKAKEILNKLSNNEHVSRWDVFTYRHFIRPMVRDNEEYSELSHEVELLVDCARESL